MAELTIEENTWKGLVQIARRRRKTPEKLAAAVLREYLQRQADEELLQESSQAAQKTRFHISETEAIIRRHRQRKKKP
jgi:hypothetical protein